ncbi:dTDP-4-dehydrorhamnose 3,5-epimerase [Brucella rhizosphaerae]|uniref:dTDP-4-dehydrorhamnose 3,5-epimerase n=1 Tax=Brucella rhizosphaerae TaxID=571254 RepID=UPI000B995613|nr:dTDP-4-dehydrorhamnose 3,5-epimerase [Brucella rhizosphaerae]
MQVRPLGLDGVVEFTPRKLGDERGFFSETYKAEELSKAGIHLQFVQDNHSHSAIKGVLRGLHYQLPPFAQDKLVRVIRGAILDVVVDIRKSSSTFGKWLAQEVSTERWNQIFVPKGFAHGFITLVENTEVVYKVTNYYSPEHDRSIRFDDPAIGIEWPIPSSGVQLSDKDQQAPLLADAEVFD